MFETCCLDRLIRIGGKSYELAPPSIRQAVEIITVFDRMEDQRDARLLTSLICSLKSTPSLNLQSSVIYGMLTSGNASLIVDLRVLLYKAFTQGHEPKKIAYEFESEKERETPEVNWSRLVESYREVYGGSRWEVWNNIPFSFFLESMKSLGQDRARQNINKAIVLHPSKESIEGWQKESKGSKPEKSIQELKNTPLTPEEEKKINEKLLRRYRG